MKINNIKWLDKSANEAEIIIADNEFSICCFAHPFKYNGYDEICKDIITFYLLDLDKIYYNKKNEYAVIKDKDYYSYILKGKIDTVNNCLIVGAFKFKFNTQNIPKDIWNNSFVEVHVPRIDLILEK